MMGCINTSNTMDTDDIDDVVDNGININHITDIFYNEYVGKKNASIVHDLIINTCGIHNIAKIKNYYTVHIFDVLVELIKNSKKYLINLSVIKHILNHDAGIVNSRDRRGRTLLTHICIHFSLCKCSIWRAGTYHMFYYDFRNELVDESPVIRRITYGDKPRDMAIVVSPNCTFAKISKTLISLFINKGAHIDIVDKKGWTTLMHACNSLISKKFHSFINIVLFSELLEHGVSIVRKSSKEETIFDKLNVISNVTMKEFIKKYIESYRTKELANIERQRLGRHSEYKIFTENKQERLTYLCKHHCTRLSFFGTPIRFI